MSGKESPAVPWTRLAAAVLWVPPCLICFHCTFSRGKVFAGGEDREEVEALGFAVRNVAATSSFIVPGRI